MKETYTGLEKYPKVSVVVPCFGKCPSLRHCIRSIEAQQYPARDVEIVVVDNNPTQCLSSDMLGADHRISIIHEPVPGSYAARNRGVFSSTGSILAFTDADCAPTPSWLNNGIKELATFHFNAAIGGKISFTFRNAAMPNIWERLDSIIHLRQEDYIDRLHFAATANLIVPRHCFAQVGLFNQEFFSGGDMDWGSRLHSQGIPIIYCPNAVVLHPARATAIELIRKNCRGVGADWTRVHIQRTSQSRILWAQVRLFALRSRIVIKEAKTNSYDMHTLFRLILRLAFIYIVRCLEAIRLMFGGTPLR